MKRDLGALGAGRFDVAIVGGGIYGACLAWESVQRGLKTALVEARDFGCGASWNSLKTIHGGIRHLQRFDIASFRESVRERRVLTRIAGGLVRPLRAVVPIYGHGAKGREAVALGFAVGNVLAADRNEGVPEDLRIGRNRTMDAAALRRLIPQVPIEGLTGGAEWTDAQARSTERLLLAFLHAASDAGAALANDAPVVSLLQDSGRIFGVRIRDGETGPPMDVAARVVVNAAGSGAAAIAALGGATLDVPLLRAINIVFAREPTTEFAIAGADEGRFLFLVPWEGRTVVGTAYAPPSTSREAMETEFLARVRRAFPWTAFRHDEIALVHEGFVPGERDADGLWSEPLIVDHRDRGGPQGLVSVVGVKYTTARAVAEAVVDRLRSDHGLPAGSSRTAATPLRVLAASGASLEERTAFAVSDEMARTVDDVVLRRLDLGTRGRPDPDAVDRVRAVLAHTTI